MKSLSVKPHWAGMILEGIKTIEIRSRNCHYRGQLLICTSGRGKPAANAPRGVALCIVDVINARRMRPEDSAAAGGVPFDPKMWSWELANVRPVEQIPVKGSLSFFDVPDHLITKRRAA